jgi:hypothetical protein
MKNRTAHGAGQNMRYFSFGRVVVRARIWHKEPFVDGHTHVEKKPFVDGGSPALVSGYRSATPVATVCWRLAQPISRLLTVPGRQLLFGGSAGARAWPAIFPQKTANGMSVVALVTHVQKFLVELGVGFVFVARQVPLDVDDFAIDLLFYHLKLRCFVVIDLKMKGSVAGGWDWGREKIGCGLFVAVKEQ